MQLLHKKKHWIFDMDGTLTIAQHDFNAIKRELGFPLDMDILTSLSKLPTELKLQKNLQLDAIELEVAKFAEASQGCYQLLEQIHLLTHSLGILTRNSFLNSLETLKAAGIYDFFSEEYLVCRLLLEKKKNPDGILFLMKEWNAKPEETIMIGDYLYDLQAGKAAGVETIYIDPSGSFPFKENANYHVKNLEEILYL